MLAPYDLLPLAIRQAVDALPAELLCRAGSIFYSGKEAFTHPAPLYVLGLNPGGSPSASESATIAAYLNRFKERNTPWSEYADECWEGAPAGSWGLQPQILHLLDRLGLDPRRVPASNVVFVQSRNERELTHEKSSLLKICWPFHQAVIESLKVETILCFGATAGAWVREQLHATDCVDLFVEQNRRGWSSRTHQTADGRQIVTVTHPSRANWKNPCADPSPLVLRALERARRVR